jgi:hypothetical protein
MTAICHEAGITSHGHFLKDIAAVRLTTSMQNPSDTVAAGCIQRISINGENGASQKLPKIKLAL